MTSALKLAHPQKFRTSFFLNGFASTSREHCKQGLASHGDLKISVFTAVLYLMQKLLHILRSDGSGSKLLTLPELGLGIPITSGPKRYLCVYIYNTTLYNHSKRTPISHIMGVKIPWLYRYTHDWSLIPDPELCRENAVAL